MNPYWADDAVTLHLGDCLEVLAGMDAASVDAVVTDPPYGLEFMGKSWDRFSGGVTDRDFKGFVLSQQRTRNVKCPDCGKWAYDHPGRLCECGGIRRAQGSAFQAWCEQWAAECLRVLRPGGHLLAFGGTRTWHRLVCAVEDAGFEIRDCTADLTGRDAPGLMWVYGSGFPKSANAERAIAVRTCVLPGRHFATDLPVPIKRLPDDHVCPMTPESEPWEGWGTALKPAWEPIAVARKPLAGTVAANVLEHGTGALNIDGCKVGPGRWPPNVLLGPDAAAELDRQSGVLTSGKLLPHHADHGKDAGTLGAFAGASGRESYGDTGGASRFFPVFRYEAKAASAERPRGDDGTAHPTVKPVDLMAWLVRLVTPPGGLVLDPFAGSGTTAEACIVEGFRCVLIEKDPAYAELIRTRLRKDIQPAMFGDAS